jgi:hypothetical protein
MVTSSSVGMSVLHRPEMTQIGYIVSRLCTIFLELYAGYKFPFISTSIRPFCHSLGVSPLSERSIYKNIEIAIDKGVIPLHKVATYGLYCSFWNLR